MTMAERRDRDLRDRELEQIELMGAAQVDELALERDLDKKKQSMQRRLKRRLMKREASSAKRARKR